MKITNKQNDFDELKAENKNLRKALKNQAIELDRNNRELEIEAALERLRARSLAMKKSEELAGLSSELVKQVEALGVNTWFCAFNFYDDDEKGSLEWGSNSQTTFPEYRTPRENIFLEYYQAGQRGETLLIHEIGEEACPAHYEYLCTLPGVGEQLLKMKEAGLSFPSSQIDHVAFHKYGYVLYITFKPVPEFHDIFKRFAKVFEQTYTRFLDLQKAEDQARKIELVNQENERLLHSILPEQIAHAIKTGQRNIVKRFEQASILFADIVGFTVLSEKAKPSEVVDILNGLFSKFDDLTDQYYLEKIKTIGDAYMVASGIPEEKDDHAYALFQFAQELLEATETYNRENNQQLQLRIGICSGPVVAGVIGKKKFAYDLWGDSVNTAARMEAYGQSGKIQVAPSSYDLLKNDFAFDKIPGVEIKGKGLMDVYLWKPNQ